MQPNVSISRLARIVAGRRVVQPFLARTLRVSPSPGAEPVPHPPTPSTQSNVGNSPPALHESRVQKSPSQKSDADKPRKKSLKPKQIITRSSKRPKSARKTKAASIVRGENAQQEQAAGRSDFSPDRRTAEWGKDELAPPPPAKCRASKLLPKKEIVLADSDPSPSGRSLPPHRVPYVRRAEGYISDVAGQSNDVLRDVESPSEHKPVAQLAHGLDRVLFNPGVYWLRDPRSRIYNFTPWLESIPAVTDFDFERVTGFIRSSMDNDLWKIAKQHKRPFGGSTSSLTGPLSHCYFLISGDKQVETSSLSRAFVHQPTTFTTGQRMPVSVALNYKDGVWLVDSDKTQELAEKNVLTWMGTMLEKFLTVSEGEFKKYLRSAPPVEDADTRREAYRYAMSDRFVMRSQLDCFDPRLPGTGVFDIKTRAAVPIRLDILNYEENSGYLIKTLTGPLESFEKEYYDLIRSAFLKYSFQARIGNMDGVLVAYHNTARIFGFQYVPLEEMEERLYGSGKGARVFNKCVTLLERILTDIVSMYGERSVKCTFETGELSQELNVWIEPIEWDEQVEGKPRPITELGVRVVSYLDGEEAKGERAVADNREWTLHWTLTESALEEAEIRRRLEGAQDRQFRALSFPAGVETVAEMKEVWTKIDFGGRRGAPEAISVKDVEARATDATSQIAEKSDREVSGQESSPQEMQDPGSDSSSSSFLSFREPGRDIRHLRRLALQGREETLREEAEGREKVVWGSVDGTWDARGQGELPLGSGTLPVSEDGTASEVDGVVVGRVGDVDGEALDGGVRACLSGEQTEE